MARLHIRVMRSELSDVHCPLFRLLPLVIFKNLLQFIADQDMPVDIDDGNYDMVSAITSGINARENFHLNILLVDILKYWINAAFLQFS
jgi:hypothetical protein